MTMRLLITAVIIFTAISGVLAQNANSSQTVRPRMTASPANTSKAADSQKSTDVQQPTTTQPAARRTEAKPKVAAIEAPGSQSVVAAFNSLINGIRHADVKAVTNVYLNSPRLILFNSNGTVTKGWEQMRLNRESSYPELKDVKLDVRDLSITMLGRDGAVVSCLWTQSQIYKGTPETATGRMTLVFKRVGKDWKAIHLHTSPDKPDPSRVLPSEQTPAATPSPTPNL
ncbi:MAG TPA: nuclear transport factor 2 family protein [Pyrinomonadaceae bacterium]|jgi:ketosteroid isomerase-like protein|nr:nuclear transport factor 2 family protein [Pyrinomonadaceae bacterium]